MSTELLYLSDGYLREFTARVERAQGRTAILDRTAFYPGGGGQPPDSGTLHAGGLTWRLVGLRREGGEILHELDRPAPEAGTEVLARIDWRRRHLTMRTHTALHILCGVIWRDYGALVTGGNMEPGRARMDFELESMSADFAREVEEKVNAEVAAGRPIRVRTLPREEAFRIPDLIRTKINLLPPQIAQVRTVEIEGLDLQADGGTHVANTREVGRIRVTGHESKGRINKRLRIEVEDVPAGQGDGQAASTGEDAEEAGA